MNLTIESAPRSTQIDKENLSTSNNQDDIKRKSLLCDYIYEKLLVDSHSLNGSSVFSKTKIIKITGTALAALCGYASWYPLALGVMNLNLNTIVKVILAGGSWISYGSLAAWGTITLVQDLFKEFTPLENALMKKKTHSFLSTVYKIPIAVMGIGSCLPNAYFAYVFNKQNIIWPIVYIVGSSGLSAYSIHNMFLDFYLPRLGIMKSFCPKDFFIKGQWNEIREFLVARLTYLVEELPEMQSDSIKKILGTREEQEENKNQVEYVRNIFERIILKEQEEARAPERVEKFMDYKIVKYPVKLISGVLPIANIYIAAQGTLRLVSELTDLTIIKILAVTVALSPSYLNYSLSRDGLFLAIKQIATKAFGKISNTLAGVYYPKSKISLLTSVTAVSLLSSALDYVVAREIFNKNDFINWAAVSTSVASNVALTLLPMIELSDILMNHYISRFGNSEIKFKQSITEKIQEISFFIKRCSQQELVNFVNALIHNEDLRLSIELRRRFPWICNDEQQLSLKDSEAWGLVEYS